METFFKKHFWAAQVAFVVVAGLLLAGTVNGFASSAFARYSVAVPEGVFGDEAAPELDEGNDGEQAAIPECVFGCEEELPPVDLCADVECEEDQECDPDTGECEAVEAEQDEEPADGRCIESDIAINLVGTIVSDDDAWSLAVLRNPSLGQTQFARIGTTLLAEAEVTGIERNRIFLMRNGRRECLRHGTQQERRERAQAAGNASRGSSDDDSSRGTNERPTARPATSRNTGSNDAPEQPRTIEQRIATEVERSDDGSYQVPRDLIQEVANNSSLMERHAPRVVPNYVNGQPRGFRLQGIRSGSIFSAIGIRNGDVIVGVNGTQIDSPQRALELYQAMLQQDSVSMEILRRGRSQTLRYDIR